MKTILSFIFCLLINSAIAQVSDFKSIDFTRADNIAKLHHGSSLDNLPILAHNLTHKLTTDAEKFRAIYFWVCDNIKGDATQDHKISKKRKQFKNDSLGYLQWNNQYKKASFKRLLKHKKTMCTGYAYLLKELCFFANIDCQIVNGYGRSVTSNIDSLDIINHSWNAVKLNKKWYLCDPTWSSGYLLNGNTFVKDFNDGYFLTDPVLFAKNHFPLEKKWYLNDSLKTKTFEVAPIVYGETFEHKIIPTSPSMMHLTSKKDEVVLFSFKTINPVKKEHVSLVQFFGTDAIPFDIYDLEHQDGYISFKTKFKHKGFFDIHLKIENDIVATYTIKVEKS
ncbi:transglutaminase domain-containing protein [Olleya aquimaris]|uniref:Transglutaminase superfamily protein n=1 Tax=Olleya aquimaris TaxID=639310 RepID=A0A327R8C3_9FLAO|nr:transglutaminase domain-containing protein [Olleya aquimaris]RAJ13029.1 transglutaminase superfamily protein [Olleya aquimaris]